MKKVKALQLCGIVCIVSICMALVLLGARAEAASPKKFAWKVFTASTPAMPIGKIYDRMGQMLNERSNGRFTLKVYYRGQLPYKTTDEIPIVRDGRVEMVDEFDMHCEGVADWIGVVTQPTVYSNVEEAKRIDKEIVVPFMDGELRKNFNSFVLFRYLQNTQAMFARKTLKCVDDLKGKRIRSPAVNQQAVINKLGGTAVYIAWGEAPTAYARGTVDGGTCGVNMAANAGWFDYLKWAWDCNLGFAFGGALVNLKAFNGLPKDLQKLFLEAGKETHAYAEDLWEKATRAGWDRARAENVTITPLTQADAGRIQAVGGEVAEAWLAKLGRSESAKKLYRLIKAARR